MIQLQLVNRIAETGKTPSTIPKRPEMLFVIIAFLKPMLSHRGGQLIELKCK